jgi:membrane protein implicated in regulation of membrane protease activity
VNTENVVKNLRVLWRTDRIIADIRMRHMLVGLGLRAFAALIAAFGLLMLELSAYFALVQIWSAISAAAILGAVNFAIAAILFLIAGRPPSGRERTRERNPRFLGRRAAARGARAAVAGIRNDPPSAQRNPAHADRAADHDHHQEPEETCGNTRGGNRRTAEIIAGPQHRPGRKQGTIPICKVPTPSRS